MRILDRRRYSCGTGERSFEQMVNSYILIVCKINCFVQIL